MGALWSFCVAVGALFLWLINTYDGDEEQPKEQQGGQQIGRKRNRRKGKPEGDKPYRPGLKYHAMYHGCLLLGTIILRVPGTSLSRFVCVELYIYVWPLIRTGILIANAWYLVILHTSR